MTNAPSNSRNSSALRWPRDVLAVALFLMVLGAMSWRLYEHRALPGPATADRWALASYRDTIYYPLRAVRDGVNPYDNVRSDDPSRYMQRYPVGDILPLYSPLMLLVFAPPALLPYGASCVAFTALNVLLFVLLAWLTLRWIGRRPSIAGVFGLAALLLASQPGRGVFNSGQIAVPLALAALGALQWGDLHLWKSCAAVVFLTLKPTFGGPLGLLLVARRDWRSALGGLLTGGILAVAGLAVIAARCGDLSAERMTQVLGRNQTDFSKDPAVSPQINKARIETAAAIEYLTSKPLPPWVAPLVTAAALGLTGWVLWRATRSGEAHAAASTASALAILAMFICMYHNIYDLPLLIVPIAACATAAHASWQQLAPGVRRSILALLMIPMVNIFWTEGFGVLLAKGGIPWGESSGPILVWVYRFACAANGLALTAAWAILLVCVARASSGTCVARPTSSGRKILHAETARAV